MHQKKGDFGWFWPTMHAWHVSVTKTLRKTIIHTMRRSPAKFESNRNSGTCSCCIQVYVWTWVSTLTYACHHMAKLVGPKFFVAETQLTGHNPATFPAGRFPQETTDPGAAEKRTQHLTWQWWHLLSICTSSLHNSKPGIAKVQESYGCLLKKTR